MPTTDLGAEMNQLACRDVVTLNNRTNCCAHVRQAHRAVQLRQWQHAAIFCTAAVPAKRLYDPKQSK